MLKVDDTLRIQGMRYRICRIDIGPDNRPVFYFEREFDRSMWYAKTNRPNRFTKVRRVFDSRNAHLDKYNAIAELDAKYRRI